jgi:hypothetical protein
MALLGHRSNGRDNEPMVGTGADMARPIASRPPRKPVL